MLARLREARRLTEKLCGPLAVEDYGVQSMFDVSPPKWHLAHTSWFFEEFLFLSHFKGYRPYHPAFGYLFNSYYDCVGERIDRSKRGMISRPTVDEVYRYRSFVDEQLARVVENEETSEILELGLNHEQQHQELILTDIKHIFWSNPLKPVYAPGHAEETAEEVADSRLAHWTQIGEGIHEIGSDAGGEFAFDNEKPRHRVFLGDFSIRSALVSNGEYLEFIRAGGYETPRFWLDQGWNFARKNRWHAPGYWIQNENSENGWDEMTLSGIKSLDLDAPVSHVSYFEAEAFASWSGTRLPTEAEWEVAAQRIPIEGSFLESGNFHPRPYRGSQSSHQFWGELWQWTSSAYRPYPGFKPMRGAFAEYNGKFMSNQMVLRGGSCVTPKSHIRSTYRNFFSPEARWQFSGIRLAR